MRFVATLLSLVMFVAAMGSGPVTSAEAAKPEAKLIVPLTGTVGVDGTFTGSFSISSFENRGGTIYAIGMVSGVVTGPAARSGISGPLALPVTPTTSSSLATRSAAVAQAATCDVLHLAFQGLTLNLLGVEVTLSPVTIDLVGGTGPLGNLIGQICNLLSSVGDVVGLVVNLLNTLLGVVGGLVGGVA